MAKGAGSQKVSVSPPMKAAWRRYESGDSVAARREATAILKSSPSSIDAEQARDLIARTKVPVQVLYFGAVAAGVILMMILLAMMRG